MDELSISASDPSRNIPYTLESAPSSSKVHDKLWVDEYRPQQYTALLGDDRAHPVPLRYLDNVQDGEDVGGLLEDLQEAVNDYLVCS